MLDAPMQKPDILGDSPEERFVAGYKFYLMSLHLDMSFDLQVFFYYFRLQTL